MSEERTCIICGGKAGSREHIFPSALGGRRISKKIYCETHNNELGKYVNPLIDVLGLFNSTISVKADRGNIPKPFCISSSDGTEYLMVGEKFSLAPPRISPEDFGKEIQLSFSSEEEFTSWVKSQKKQGLKIELVKKGKEKSKIFTESFHKKLEIGTDDFKLANLYLAITFLAYFYPEIAKQEGLNKAKQKLIESKVSDDFFNWVNPNKLPFLKDYNLQNKHLIAIGINSREKKANAIICFFGNLCLSINIGRIESEISETKLAIIDPLAEHAGENYDFKEITLIDKELIQVSSDDSHTYLNQVIKGEVENPIKNIILNAENYNLDSFFHKSVEDFIEIKENNSDILDDFIIGYVNNQKQRIFNLIKFLINDYLETQKNLPKEFTSILKEILESSNLTESGLTELGEAAQKIGQEVVAHEIKFLLQNNNLNKETLKKLFNSGEGAGKIGEKLFNWILS